MQQFVRKISYLILVLATIQADLAMPASAIAPTAISSVATTSEKTIAEVVKSAMPSIARVRIFGFQLDQTGKRVAFSQTGTAFLVDGAGNLVTNCHVASLPQAKLVGPLSMTVEFADDQERLPATVRGCDRLADIAVLHVDHVDSHRGPLRFAEAATIVLGQRVISMGYGLDISGQPSIAEVSSAA
jgi:S1-C subfamily serine protease